MREQTRHVFEVEIEGDINPGWGAAWDRAVLHVLENLTRTDVFRNTVPMCGGHRVVSVRKKRIRSKGEDNDEPARR